MSTQYFLAHCSSRISGCGLLITHRPFASLIRGAENAEVILVFSIDLAFSGVNGKRKVSFLCALCVFAVKTRKVIG